MISHLKDTHRHPYAVGNSLIGHLQDSLKDLKRQSADCLILTHDDSDLVRRFEPVMRRLNALHLPLAQEEWNFDESDLAAAVSWSIREAGIVEIYICGHSLACSDDQHWSAKRPSDPNEEHSMLSRLLDNQNRLQNAKNIFAQQVTGLLAVPEVNDALKNSALKVYPLFFLAQAGAFMCYDPAAEEFHPLVSDKAGM